MKATSGSCFVILVCNLLLGGWTVKYVLETWMPFIVHHAVNVPWLPAVIAGLFVGEISVPVAILTWLIKLCGVL